MKKYLCILLGLKLVLASNTSTSCVWKADKLWYKVANTTLQYHITIKRMKHASCETGCDNLGNNISFAAVSETVLQQLTRWRNILLWIMNSSPTSKRGCDYALNGTVLLSNDCNSTMRCICQRRSSAVANMTSTLPTEIAEPANIDRNCRSPKPHLINTWISITGKSFEYLVTKEKIAYDRCAEICAQQGNQTEVATLNSRSMPNTLLGKISNIQTWIFKADESNKSVCNFLYKRLLLTQKNCQQSMRCLCQKHAGNITVVPRPIENQTSHNSIQPIADQGWIQVKDRQFLIHIDNLTFERASDFCKRRGAALIFFTNPIQYTSLPASLPLRGEYWVEGGLESTRESCLVLEVTRSIHLKQANCKTELQSICSRITNATIIVSRPDFVEMIENMTINDLLTSKKKRQLTSAEDKRTFATAVGIVIGVGVIAVVGILVILNDLQTWHMKSQKKKKKTNKQKKHNIENLRT